ncbi:MAG: beta strand repeat-containing protein [Vicinamibacterales bacterium]
MSPIAVPRRARLVLTVVATVLAVCASIPGFRVWAQGSSAGADRLLVADVNNLLAVDLTGSPVASTVAALSGTACHPGPGFASFWVDAAPDGTLYGVVDTCGSGAYWGRVDPATAVITTRHALDASFGTLTRFKPAFLPAFPAAGQPLGYRFRQTANRADSSNPIDFYAVDSLDPYSEHLLYSNVGNSQNFNFGLGTAVRADGTAYYVTVNGVYRLDPTTHVLSQVGFLSLYNISNNAALSGMASDDQTFYIVDGGRRFGFDVTTGDVTNPLVTGMSQGVAAVLQRAPWGGVRIEPHTGLVTTESGGTATFTAVLTVQPTASVTLTLSSSDATEGTVSPSTLTFTTANWNVPQTVTVTGAADLLTDGSQAYTIVTSATSSGDANYSGRTVLDVNVTNTNVNVAPTLSAIAAQTIQQGQSTSVSFTVADESPASVTVTAASSNPTLVPAGGLVLGGSGASRTLAITPTTGQSGTATITLTATDGSAAGTTSFVVTVPANQAPTISAVPDQRVALGTTAVGPLAFTIGDDATATSALTVSATSSNPALVPQSGLALGGNAASRTLVVTPSSGQTGTSTISLAVGDGQATTTTAFTVTVTAPPTITPIGHQQVPAGTAQVGPLAFTVADDMTAASALAVSASSSNPALVPPAGLVLGGSAANRTVTIFPVAGQVGTATVTIAVSDGVATGTAAFVLTVVAAVPPGAPTGFAAVVRDGRFVDMSWQPSTSPGTGAPTGYRVEAGTTSGAADAGSVVLGPVTSLTHEVGMSGRLFLRVRAFNEQGLSAPSNEVAVTLADGAPPTNLRADVNGTSVRMTWTPPADAASVRQYVVEAGSAAGATNLGTLTAGVPELVLAGVPGGTYFVRVRAERASGRSRVSNEVAFTVGAGGVCTAAPGAPQALSAVANGTTLSVSWQAPAGGDVPAGYQLHVGSSTGASDLGVITFAAETVAASATVPNGTYFFRVFATNPCGTGPASAEASATVGGAPQAPGAPSNLTAVVEGTTVVLGWSAPATGGAASRYVLEVLDGVGNLLAALETGGAATTFTHAATPSGTYVIRVRAGNAAGLGDASDAVTVTVP